MVVKDSLSVVLAVRNAEPTLVKDVAKLLDLLPDLTHRFEILIVDDGSEDHTAEVAWELAREYPQIRVVEHGRPLGRTGIVQTALVRTSGEILLVQHPGVAIDSSKFQRLWALRSNETMLGPVADHLRNEPSLRRRLAAWAVQLDVPETGNPDADLQLIHRGSDIRPQPRPHQSMTTGLKNVSRLDHPEPFEFRRLRDPQPRSSVKPRRPSA